jgi:nucleotide-binding universal stress UspA family protein
MQNIMVAVDLKHTDNMLLSYATALVEKFNSKIWVVHIAEPQPDFIGYRVGPTYIRDMRAEELMKEHKELREMAAQLKLKLLQAEALLIQGPTVSMIHEEVLKLNIDLLIMGSHKRGFLFEMVMGNTSSIQVIKKTSIPVLTIPLPDWE